MFRRTSTAILIALFVAQNFVCCCGHVHAEDGGDICRPHVHLHSHAHPHSHHGHSHNHDRSDTSETNQQQQDHDYCLESLKQDAIIQNSKVIGDGWSEIEISAAPRIAVGSCYVQTLAQRRATHLYWQQSSAIHLQVRALLI